MTLTLDDLDWIWSGLNHNIPWEYDENGEKYTEYAEYHSTFFKVDKKLKEIKKEFKKLEAKKVKLSLLQQYDNMIMNNMMID